jgi:predicted RNA-binding Zn ribbon-like protein
VSGNQYLEDRSEGEPTNAATVGLLGGELCLDFANTVEPRLGSHRSDYLASYADLVRWARHAGSLSEEEAQRLLLEAEDKPSEARAAWEQAVALRETVYRVFSAVAEEEQPEASDLDALTAAHLEALAHYSVVPTARGFGWARAEGSKLEGPLWSVALSATRLLTTGELERVKECPTGEGGCGWLFYDASKNKSRRWCSMADCGSRVKMRRMYARRRSAGSKERHEA